MLLLLAPILLSFAFATGTANTTMNNTTLNGQPAERYELCKSTEEIQWLQRQYELTLVSSVPTKAAFMPGWPSTAVGFVLSMWTIISAAISRERNSKTWYNICLLVFTITLMYAVSICWIISYARIEAEDKATGGWVPIGAERD
jgi:hypothetical protein